MESGTNYYDCLNEEDEEDEEREAEPTKRDNSITGLCDRVLRRKRNEEKKKRNESRRKKQRIKQEIKEKIAAATNTPVEDVKWYKKEDIKQKQKEIIENSKYKDCTPKQIKAEMKKISEKYEESKTTAPRRSPRLNPQTKEKANVASTKYKPLPASQIPKMFLPLALVAFNINAMSIHSNPHHTPVAAARETTLPPDIEHLCMPAIHPVTGELISSYSKLKNDPATAE